MCPGEPASDWRMASEQGIPGRLLGSAICWWCCEPAVDASARFRCGWPVQRSHIKGSHMSALSPKRPCYVPMKTILPGLSKK